MSALIWTTFADRESARESARTLIEEGMAACANFIATDSIYAWNGEMGEGTEIGVLFKTSSEILDRAVLRLENLHPYDSPAILGWQCSSAGVATTEWLAALAGGGANVESSQT